jgi:hypothetical protein
VARQHIIDEAVKLFGGDSSRFKGLLGGNRGGSREKKDGDAPKDADKPKPEDAAKAEATQ